VIEEEIRTRLDEALFSSAMVSAAVGVDDSAEMDGRGDADPHERVVVVGHRREPICLRSVQYLGRLPLVMRSDAPWEEVCESAPTLGEQDCDIA
jgi:hypothetical protein